MRTDNNVSVLKWTYLSISPFFCGFGLPDLLRLSPDDDLREFFLLRDDDGLLDLDLLDFLKVYMN